MTHIETRLRPVQVRMGVNRFLANALLGLALAWGAAALVLFLDKLLYIPYPMAWLPWAATGAPLVAAGIGALWRRASVRQAAVLVDERLGLAERLSSALLVSGTDPMEAAVRADAERHLSRVSAAVACPVSVRKRRAWMAVLALAALGLAAAAPRWDLLKRKAGADARDKALLEVKTAGSTLEQKVQKYAEEAKAKGVEKGEVGKGMEQLAKDLKDGIQDPQSALASISDMQSRLKSEAEQFNEKDKAALAKDLQKAMQSMGGKAPSGPQADSLKDMIQDLKELSDKAASGKASASELAQMQKTLSDLAQALGKTEATKELASELSRAAQAMNNQEQQKGAMPQMSDNLKNLANQLGQMDKALDKEQMMELAKSDLESLKQQLTGQDPWKGEISQQDMQAFQQKMEEQQKNQQAGGT